MRIYIPPEDIQQKEKIKLSSDKSHHLITVFRCKQGNAITVIDGKGKAYEAEVSRIVKKDVFINIIREVSTDVESPLNLVICQGILRGEKMDIVVQKTTELGIKGIIPIITERTVIRDTRRLKRWRKIAEESVEQCGRTIIPVIHEPVYFEDFFKCQQSSVLSKTKWLDLLGGRWFVIKRNNQENQESGCRIQDTEFPYLHPHRSRRRLCLRGG